MTRLFSTLAAVLVLAGSASAAEPTSRPAPASQPVTGQTIIFLGDSITANGVKPLGYVSLTALGLKANGIDATVLGAGVGGNTSKDMLARLPGVLAHKPDWMALSCGVNDVWHGERGVPLDQFKTNITSIVEQAQAAHVKVMILTATVITEDPTSPFNLKLAAYNDFLRALAKEKNCLLGDLNADFQALIKAAPKPGSVLTVDGVHMNVNGDLAMARGVLRAFGLTNEQMTKADETWLDLPNTCEFRPVLQGRVLLTLRQRQRLEAIAAKHKLTAAQMIQTLYAADLAGAPPTGTAAEIEAYLDQQEKKDAAATMQEDLNKRVGELEK